MKLSVKQEGKFAIISISGDIEWQEAHTLDNAVKDLLHKGLYNIAFDLNDVSFICSAGIGALVYHLNTIKINKGAIYIISSSKYIDFMFETLKLNLIFEGSIYPSYAKFRQKIISAK